MQNDEKNATYELTQSLLDSVYVAPHILVDTFQLVSKRQKRALQLIVEFAHSMSSKKCKTNVGQIYQFELFE